ncbi:hypothetical protein [Robbsia andropogonis]|uniref:hypothetical protein n=1 Tax=Robbsia andropogonis TaxID=28092 RepID=UPI000466188C|nr:hypothetical protein [Robbsia andropogonis]MCP1118214.1 hypothetical protein [Robbsia andropogonis]MCP1127505.1 hypothetical protein [Robbsia andropogonis]
MSIFSKIKHAFQHLGHDIENAAKAVVHGVEHVVHALENDIKKVLQDALAMTEALMQGNLKEAMQDLLKTAEDVEKTASDAYTAGAEATLEGLKGLHLGKGFDKVLNTAEKGVETVKKDINQGIDSVASDLVSSAEGIVSGSVNAVKDLAHGNFKGMMNDMENVASDALDVAADLTPEGLGANVVASTLAAAHVGSAQLDDAIAGAMHGGVGKVVKAVAKTEASEGAQKLSETVLGDNGTQTAEAGATAGAALFAGGAGRGGRRGTQGTREPSERFAKTSSNGTKNSNKADGTSEKEADAKQTQDKSKEPDDKTKQAAGTPPSTLNTLLLSYLEGNQRKLA